ncbi:hypothetical protein VP01_882g2 [Puccinia sorghi]|uniref:Peptide N-acetyl-beta-D-glucosaminyl asparaginase amidase A N-terminal domain-containing protein n=1 Tax=Puccinia sorghi TaxID=27349 RepID=A0A0L6U8A9_9BASI|nr:hypothetical protein VP01_882g2 [Puccinia sorghi]
MACGHRNTLASTETSSSVSPPSPARIPLNPLVLFFHNPGHVHLLIVMRRALLFLYCSRLAWIRCMRHDHEPLSGIGVEGAQLVLSDNRLSSSSFSMPILRRRQMSGATASQGLNTSGGGLLENFQVTQPPVVPQEGKSCHQSLLQTTFANSVGKPARVTYSAPKECGEPRNWASVILKLTVSEFPQDNYPRRLTNKAPLKLTLNRAHLCYCLSVLASSGNQFDRLSAFLQQLAFPNGLFAMSSSEIMVLVMRTSTAEPTPQGITWTIEKDVTKYIPLLSLPEASLVMNLENIIDKTSGIDGVFFVELFATYYTATPGFPASITPDVILPLSEKGASPFSVPPAATISVQFPINAVSAMVEIYASGADKEESDSIRKYDKKIQYTNPLDQVSPELNRTLNDNDPAKGSFREVQLWIDDRLAGVVYPFPVIFTGGMLLTWWRPMAAYGSLDQPTYQIDITPFLPALTDSLPHNFTLTVEGQGENGSINSKWFLSGNIAITLDPSGKSTCGKILSYYTDPTIKIFGGVCGGSVCTTTDASRKLFIESAIITGSNQRRKVSFKQELAYQSKHILALDGSSQVSSFNGYFEVAQLSTGSSSAITDAALTYSDDFSFPLKVSLESGQTGLKGEINLTYNRKVKPNGKGFATSIQTTQIAMGTLELAGPNRASAGQGQTGQVFFYSDERGSSFARDLIVRNVTEKVKDVLSGSLSKSKSS